MGLFKSKHIICDNCEKEILRSEGKDVCQECLDTCRKIPTPLPGDVLTAAEVEKETESNSVTETEETNEKEAK